MSKAKVGLYWLSHNGKTMTENSVRHIETLREMEAHKLHYQIRCSHHELELAESEKSITCVICGKHWQYTEERGYRDSRRIFAAAKDG